MICAITESNVLRCGLVIVLTLGLGMVHPTSVLASPGGEVWEIIVLPGSGFSGISPGFSGECSWSSDGSVIWTWWDKEWCETEHGISQWVEFTVSLSPGLWRIGLEAINHFHPGHGLGEDPSWYPQFEVGNSLTPDIIVIPASDTEVNQGYIEYEISTGGPITVRYWWLNDGTVGQLPDGGPELDANIKIVDAFFARVTRLVAIDIKPGSYPNCFNSNGHGVIPVAILGSDTLDVTQIDASTLQFDGATVRIKGTGASQCGLEDVSGDSSVSEGMPDGYLDLVCQFVDEGGFASGEGEASVTGQLFDGTVIIGTDSICVVP